MTEAQASSNVGGLLASGSRRLGSGEYARLRRLIIYVPQEIQVGLLAALTSLLEASGIPDETRLQAMTERIKEYQSRLRKLLGLEAIEGFIQRLGTE
jgi:hypothetical protein